jgi:hypothetical protein
MKRFCAFALFALVLMMPACQCDTPPPIGPVDDARAALSVALPDAA